MDWRFRLRGGGRTRLIAGRDRVRLIRPRPGDATHRRVSELNNVAIPFGRVESIEPVFLDGASASYRLPNGTFVPLSEGPALRVTGSGQEWVLPINAAESIADFLRARVHANPDPVASALTPEQWQDVMHRREMIRRSGTGEGSSAPSYYRFGFVIFAALTMASFVANDSVIGKIAGALCFGAGALGCLMGWSNAASIVRTAEEWPEKPSASESPDRPGEKA